jgi:hypothetical protein
MKMLLRFWRFVRRGFAGIVAPEFVAHSLSAAEREKRPIVHLPRVS